MKVWETSLEFYDFAQSYRFYKDVLEKEPTPDVEFNGRPIGMWREDVLKAHREDTLTKEERAVLYDVGFSFDGPVSEKDTEAENNAASAPRPRRLNGAFVRSALRYKEYKDTFGEEPPLDAVFKGEKVGAWRRRMLYSYRDDELDTEHLLFLKKVGFDFENIVREGKFSTMLSIYKMYKREFDKEPLPGEAYKEKELGNWCEIQKQKMEKGELQMAKALKLSHAGFPVDLFFFANKNEQQWEEKFVLYKHFKKDFKREPVKREEYMGVKLGSWCHTQQKKYVMRELPEDKEKKLRGAGFPLDKRDRIPTFEEMLFLYKSYKEVEGREPYTKEKRLNTPIGEWCAMQDFLHMQMQLPKEHYEALLEVGFPFTQKVKPLNWNQMFFLYKSFKAETGTEPTRHEIYKCAKLGRWVEKVRDERDLLTEKQLNQLHEAGFVFDVVDSEWQKNYDLLKEYLSKFGKFPAPHSSVYKDANLGLWLNNQKQYYKLEKFLPNGHKEMLEELGFSFEIKDFEAVWTENYETLKKFIENHNRFPHYEEVYEGKRISRWLSNQKQCFNQDKLRADRQERLEALGVRFPERGEER